MAEKVGWDIDLLNVNASFEAEIAAENFADFVIDSPPTASLAVSPATASVLVGQDQAFTATRSDGQTKPVTWSVVGGAGDTITSAGVLHVAAPPGRTFTVVASDSTGATGEATVTAGTPLDPPKNLQHALAADGRSGSLTWQPPDFTGGSSLTSYTVVTDPATKTQTVPASTTTVTLSGLTPGVPYTVKVFAANAGGLTSAPATDFFTPSVTCSITWTGGGGTGSWSDAANWTPQRTPTSRDLACITTGASVSLSHSATIFGLTLTRSSLTVTGALTTTDLLAISSATLAGNGSVTVASAATASIVGSSTLASGVTLENAGVLTFVGGSSTLSSPSGPGQIVNDAGATINVPDNTFQTVIAAPLTNRGAITVGPGQLYLGATVENAGSISLADNTIVNPTANGTLTNDAGATISYPGTANKNAVINVPLTNHGTVTTSGGMLLLSSGGSPGNEDTGAINIGAGATIDLTDGARGFAPAASVSGPGTFEVGGGSVTFSGVLSGPVLQLGGRRLELTSAANGGVASLTLGAPSTLQIDLSAATPAAGPALIQATGQAQLGGALVVKPDAGFTPPGGNGLPLLDYGSATGTFAVITAPPGYNVAVGRTEILARTPASSGAITGTIRGAAGTPVANVCVYPFEAATGARTSDAAACTDANGGYTLSLAKPGSYNVVFYDPTGGHVTQWYVAARYESGATPVAVAGGTVTPGINAVIAGSTDAGTTIAGTVTDAAGHGITNVCVYPFDAHTGDRTADAAACTDSSGTYTLTLGAAGSYNVVFYDASGGYVTQWYRGATYEGSATPVAVTTGARAAGVDAVLSSTSATAGIVGTVTDAAGHGLSNICVYPFDAATGNRTADPAACTDASGKYALAVPAGSYRVVFYDPSGAYATQWYSNAPYEGLGVVVVVTSGTSTTGIDATLAP